MKVKFKFFLFLTLTIIFCTGCSEENKGIPETSPKISGYEFLKRDENKYAEKFAIDRYDGGYSIIHTMDSESFLIVPQGMEIPQCSDEDITVLQQPMTDVYLVATSAMGLFDELGCGDVIKFSGTKAEDWCIDYARNAMEKGDMLYAGKYREPDYELLMKNKCRLSVQSSMIGHSPEVKDKLEELGIDVFVDYSSYEPHPLGRSEWIKIYGEICGKTDTANELFDAQTAVLENLMQTGEKPKTVVYFYISTSGQAVTRKSGDYVTKMIELAGGKNIFEDIGDDKKATSTVTMEMEEFYRTARDADFIIYNSTISGQVGSIEELISKNELLADFKAVKNGDVWCANENLFQEILKLGQVINDFNLIFSGETENKSPEFLFRLESGGE